VKHLKWGGNLGVTEIFQPRNNEGHLDLSHILPLATQLFSLLIISSFPLLSLLPYYFICDPK
jgi:hypothetical protein